MGKGKEKGPELLTEPEAFEPWGLALNDEISTPLGTIVTVIGVKGGQLWVRWPGGQECASGLDSKTMSPAQANLLPNLGARSLTFNLFCPEHKNAF